MLKTTFLFMATFISTICIAQYKEVSTQLLANPNDFFPEFAGWRGGLQVNAQIGINGTRANVGIDAYSHKLRSGFGINLRQLGSIGYLNGLNIDNILEFNWSPKLTLFDEVTLMPAISGKLGNSSFNSAVHGSWFYGDPSGWSTDPIPQPASVKYSSFGVGLGIVYKETFIASHVHDINEPLTPYYGDLLPTQFRIYRTYSFIAGRVFTIDEFNLTPSVMYHRNDGRLEGGPNLLVASLNLNYQGLYVSANYDFIKYENLRAVGLALGAELKERIRISTSIKLAHHHLSISQQYQGPMFIDFALRVWLFKDRAKKQFLSNLPLM